MCILLYVKLIWCSGIPYIYGQLEGGTCAECLSTYVYSSWPPDAYMLNLCSVVVFHRSMVKWRGTSALGICAFCYM